MKLKIITPTDIYDFEAVTETLTIGRSSECDVVIPLPDFSRKQCVLTFKKGYAFIMDPGSKNGIKVDGKKILPNVQTPVYGQSKVVLANNSQLLFPEGTLLKEIDKIDLELDR